MGSIFSSSVWTRQLIIFFLAETVNMDHNKSEMNDSPRNCICAYLQHNSPHQFTMAEDFIKIAIENMQLRHEISMLREKLSPKKTFIEVYKEVCKETHKKLKNDSIISF